MTGIENTTKRMKDPVYRALMFDGTVNPGGRPGMIEQQERDGQEQLVASELLPADHGDDVPWLALGFTFGEPAKGDPLFVPATLPEGWEREGSDHAMWSYLRDRHGRKRVAIFYKAAWYDRSAFMRQETVWGYVRGHVEHGEQIVITDEWATRESVLAAMREHLKGNSEEAAEFRGYAAETGTWRDEANRAECARIAGEREAVAAKYEMAIAELETAADA